MRWQVVGDHTELSSVAAGLLLAAVREKPTAVLGLPTGATPEGMYRNVIAACRRDYHCFSKVSTFNLDEYVGIDSSHPASYRAYMQTRLFDHVDLAPGNIHIPDGTAARFLSPSRTESEALDMECSFYEQTISDAGGIDLMFLGLGTNGHIGFNEPGSPFTSRTRRVTLTESTRLANAPWFAGEVPREALTMGIGTILESRRIILLASGAKKRDAVARLHDQNQTEAFPASALQSHPDVLCIVDRAAM